MDIDGRRQAHERLQQAVQACRLAQVFAADHMRDALPGIVDDACHVVAGAGVLAAQHDIAEAGCIGRAGEKAGIRLFDVGEFTERRSECRAAGGDGQAPGEGPALGQIAAFFKPGQHGASERLAG